MLLSSFLSLVNNLFDLLTCFKRCELFLISGSDNREAEIFIHQHYVLNFTSVDEDCIREEDLTSLNEFLPDISGWIWNK